MELNHPAQIQLDTVSENCFFYISPMYEFSHSQDHFRPNSEGFASRPLPLRLENGHSASARVNNGWTFRSCFGPVENLRGA